MKTGALKYAKYLISCIDAHIINCYALGCEFSNQKLGVQMSILKLYSVKDGGDLSPLDCENINLALTKISISDIPQEQIENVIDYLATALNNNSVEHSLMGRLDTLLEDLQATVK